MLEKIGTDLFRPIEIKPQIYVGDKIVATLWTCDPSTLPAHNNKGVVLKGYGPLFRLEEIQKLLNSGQLDLDDDQQCWVATRFCVRDMENLQWTTGNQVKRLLLALRPGTQKQGGDFINAQWCQDSYGGMVACDSYTVKVDEYNNFWRSPNGLPYYVKFSIAESGALCLFLVGCHLSR